MNTLVVFYSRSGTTREAAERIARKLGADIEEIVDPTDRRGIRGWIRSILDARRGRKPPISPARKDPSRYDLVVIGTPVWDAHVSAPVRAYLSAHAGSLRRVAFFVTEGGRGESRVFREMRELAGRSAVATLLLLQRDVQRGRDAAAINAFVRMIRVEAAPSERSTSQVHA
ncbi:MAG TPA: flavodoxin [Polyangiaceae bacterium]